MNYSHKFYKALLLTSNQFSLYWQTVPRLIFGHICRISWRWLPSTLVFFIGPIDWYPAASAASLPSHCLGTDTFINGLLHASLSFMWNSLVPVRRTLLGSIYLAYAASGESGLLKCLQLLSSTPQNTCVIQSAPTFSSCSLMFSNPAHTASTPCLCGAFIPKNIFSNK